MEQKDYILREIEKIGTIVRAVWESLFGGKDNSAITIKHQIDDAKEQLLKEINFDLAQFLDLNTEKSNEYILSFEGFNIENIELLAECISEMGFNNTSDNSKKYLEKALQLYDLCNLKSKTYSIERERNIRIIKDAL